MYRRLLVRKKNKNSRKRSASLPGDVRARVLSDIVKRRSFRANVERLQGRATGALLLHPYSSVCFLHPSEAAAGY